jgi:hypothetical protein
MPTEKACFFCSDVNKNCKKCPYDGFQEMERKLAKNRRCINGRDPIIPVGCLAPTKAKKAYRVLIQVNGKVVCAGLVKKESLLQSLNSASMGPVEISIFQSNPSASKSHVGIANEGETEL